MSGFVAMGALVLLAVHLVASTALSLLAAAFAPRLLRASRREPTRRRTGLLALALLPGAGGLLASLGLALPAWLAYEPRATGESAGAGLLALAAIGALLLVVRVGGAAREQRATSRLVASWRRDGRELRGLPLEATGTRHARPVAAVAGVFRPRLLLSEPLLAALEPDELAAVAAHEQAHVRARDNLKRLLLRGSPDPLALTRAGRELRAAFELATEEAADAEACRRVPPLVLARTLLKVASLAPRSAGTLLPVAALYGEGSIAARVRALLEQQPAPPQGAASRVTAAWLLLLPAACVALAVVWPGVHRAVEALVRLLS